MTYATNFYLYSVKDNSLSGEYFAEQVPFKSLSDLVNDIYGQDYDVARVIRVGVAEIDGADLTANAARLYLSMTTDLTTIPVWVRSAIPDDVLKAWDDKEELERERLEYDRDLRSHNYYHSHK